MPLTRREALARSAAELRRLDYDRYLTALFAPAPGRARLVALYAFNQEVARTAELVSEPMLGAIRLQWWRETVDDAYRGQVRDHPVAHALAHSGALDVVSREALLALIDARERDLDPAPFADRAEFEAYAEATSSRLMALALQALGAADDAPAQAAAKPGGIAWALVGLMRAVPALAARGRCPIPETLLGDYSGDVRALGERRVTAGVRAAVSQVAAWAAEHLAAAHTHAPPNRALPALLPLALARLYHRRLERAGFDPFAAALKPAPLARQAALIRSRLRGRP